MCYDLHRLHQFPKTFQVDNMQSFPSKLTSLLMVAVMVGAVFLVATPSVAAETASYDLGKLEVITGTVGEDPGASEKLNEAGDFIAIRFGDDSWFSVVYGTDESPNYIHMRSHQKQYLGGATVVKANGDTIDDARPIPVIRNAGQALTSLIEFQDDGYQIGFGDNRKTIGADNGLFDYKPKQGWQGHSTFQAGKREPIQKAVSLSTNWTRSDIEVDLDQERKAASVNFSLTATNLSYIYLNETAPDPLPVLENVTLTFHLQAQAVERDVEVPWFKVTVKQREAIDSQVADTRHYHGTTINSTMKYDHFIDGWNYTQRGNSTRLMLMTFTSFATFIPQGVEKWFKAQYLDEHLKEGNGMAEYEVDYEIDQDTGDETTYKEDGGRGGDNGDDGGDGSKDFDGKPDGKGKVKYRPEKDYLNKVQRIKKNQLTFNDNWERVARFSWVSEVDSTIDDDTTTENLTYQIHAIQPLQLYLAKADLAKKTDRLQDYQSRGIAKGIVVMGGYIYPAGDTLFHDPSFETATNLVEILDEAGEDLQDLLDELAAIQIVQLFLVAAIAVAAVGMTHRRLKR